MTVTFQHVETCCSSCGEYAPVRVLDHDGYAPNEIICEACFSHDVASWDDLPEAIFPQEE